MSSHVNAVCMGWGGGISVCQLITLPVCLCYHHRSWSGARAAGVEYVCTDMQEAGGVSQHLSWMAPSLFEYLFFFSTSAPKSCHGVSVSRPTIGSPFTAPAPPHEVGKKKQNNSKVSSGQPVFISGEETFSVCLCARAVGAVGAIERRQRRRTVCTYTCIGVSVRALMCVLERGPNSMALVLLQGAVMSSSHFSTVFSHQCESHRSSSLRGEVCVCVCV